MIELNALEEKLEHQITMLWVSFGIMCVVLLIVILSIIIKYYIDYKKNIKKDKGN